MASCLFRLASETELFIGDKPHTTQWSEASTQLIPARHRMGKTHFGCGLLAAGSTHFLWETVFDFVSERHFAKLYSVFGITFAVR